MATRYQLGISLAAIALSGCGERRLVVDISVPQAYRNAVEQLSLKVVEPGGLDISCDDIALGLIDDDVLDARVVQKITIRRGDGGPAGLDRVSREADKLLWAVGYSAAGREIVAGCESTPGAIDSLVEVAVGMEPSATLTVASGFDLFGFDITGELPDEIPVTVTDALGAGILGYTLGWQLLGPGQTGASDEIAVDDNGVGTVQIQVALPPGPYAIDFQGRWLRGRSEPIFGMTNPPELTVAFPDYPRAYEVGRVVEIGTGVVPGVVSLAQRFDVSGALQGYVISVTWYDPAGADLATASTTLAPSAPWGPNLSKFTTPDDVDHVIFLRNMGVGDKRWVEVTVTNSAVQLTELGPSSAIPSDLSIATQAIDVHPCSGDPALSGSAFLAVFLKLDLTLTRRVYDATGAYVGWTPWEDLPTAFFNGSTCLGTGAERRALVRLPNLVDPEVFTLSADGTALVAHKMDNLFGLAEALPAVGTWPGRVVGVRMSGTDAVLGFYELDSADILRLAYEEPISGANAGQRVGDLDGDGEADLVILVNFATGGGSAGGVMTRFLIRSGRAVRDTTVRGYTSEREAINPRHFVADLDDDGYDDIVLTQRRAVADGVSGVALPPDIRFFPMGAP